MGRFRRYVGTAEAMVVWDRRRERPHSPGRLRCAIGGQEQIASAPYVGQGLRATPLQDGLDARVQGQDHLVPVDQVLARLRRGEELVLHGDLYAARPRVRRVDETDGVGAPGSP
jgi:hypothetical protein